MLWRNMASIMKGLVLNFVVYKTAASVTQLANCVLLHAYTRIASASGTLA